VLLADNVNPVKQALMEKSVTQLAVFFGKPKGENRKTEEQKKAERLRTDV
jgi:hypothetical protein